MSPDLILKSKFQPCAAPPRALDQVLLPNPLCVPEPWPRGVQPQWCAFPFMEASESPWPLEAQVSLARPLQKNHKMWKGRHGFTPVSLVPHLCVGSRVINPALPAPLGSLKRKWMWKILSSYNVLWTITTSLKMSTFQPSCCPVAEAHRVGAGHRPNLAQCLLL